MVSVVPGPGGGGRCHCSHGHWSPHCTLTLDRSQVNISSVSPQAPDRFNPKVRVQTCGIIQKLYETKHIETMMFGKSVMGHFSKIEPKTSK